MEPSRLLFHFSEKTLRSTQKITRAAFLTAVCVVLGYLFMPIPNLEMITAGIFLAGVWMGPIYGFFIGLVAETIFSLFNPMGFPPPPLLISQVASMSLVGWVGGLLHGVLGHAAFFRLRNWTVHLMLALIGIALTLIFDLLTNLSFPLAAGFTLKQIRLALLMGIPFAVIHITVNAFTFALIIPVFLNRFKSWRLP